GTAPTVFANTGLIYSDEIGARLAEMGYKAALSNSPGHILQWRSPNYLYSNAINPQFAVLLKNHPLSDDIASWFSNHDWAGWPLTAKKFVSWLNKIPKEENIVNLFMDYETFGEHQRKESGIFNFLRLLPSAVFEKSDIGFMTPSEIVAHYPAISTINVPFSNSWADNDWNVSSCLGNELQQEAFEQLYCLNRLVDHCRDPGLIKDWQYLQTSDHFYYMNTNHFSSANGPIDFNPYNSPYDAFINYMNVLNDFVIRLNMATGNGKLDGNKERNEELLSKY
ncbi:MAG TPA: alpha-amylase, partial [Prolixibacteraceae bacterium]|nr:alpha-amylase [Prolixibacteraceae bacterium]